MKLLQTLSLVAIAALVLAICLVASLNRRAEKPRSQLPAAHAPARDPSYVVSDNPTTADMAKKGLPVPSNPRQFLLDDMKNQTLEDCSRDLGNPETLLIAGTSTLVTYHHLSYWGPVFNHAKALRLIEVGHEDPKKVAGLVLDELRRDLADPLDEMGRNSVAQVINKTRHPPSNDNDYYREHRQYQDLLSEFERRMHAIGQCFYVLACIGELSQAQSELARFCAFNFRVADRPLSLDVLLIAGCAIEMNGKGLPVDEALLADVASIKLGGTMRSAPDAVLDVTDPLAAAVHVNMSGVRTIPVVAVPSYLPKDMTPDKQERILAEFIDAVASHGKTEKP